MKSDIKNHLISMYPLLPAMRFTNMDILLKAIDEMVEYYRENETELGQQLLWFKTFLDRTETIPTEEKKKVEERLDTLNQLLEQSPYVLKQRAKGEEEGYAKGRSEGRAEGRAEGKAEGLIEGQVFALRLVLVDTVSARYPSLVELAKERASRTGQAEALRELINILHANLDEDAVRAILSTLPAA